MREFADPIPPDDLFGHSFDLKPAARELEILRTGLQKPGGEPPSLLPDLHRGLGERVSAETGAAAAERADRLRRAQGVAVADDHVVVRDAEMVGDDLGEGRLVPLAVRARSGDGGGLSGPFYPANSPLPAPRVGGIDA